MKEIREIFETVSTYCGMMFLDAKRPRGEEDKSVTGKMYCHALLSEGEKEVVNELERILQPQERGWQKTLQTCTPLSHIRNTRYTLVNDCDLSLGEVASSIQSNPSPELVAISRHSEALLSRKNPAYLLYNTSKLKGIAFKVVPIS